MRDEALHNPGVPIELELGGLSLRAFAISGLASYVLVPRYALCFDLGHCSMEASGCREVFLTHVHQDHAGGVQRHLSLRAMRGAPASRIYCPEESADDLRGLLRAWSRLERREAPDLDELVRGVSPGDRISLRKNLSVEVFDVIHRLPSRGYTLVERARSLSEAWVGRSGDEIAAAVRSGAIVHDERLRRRLTYVGDSTIETFALNPQLADCDVLFIEATHLPGTPLEAAHRWGHTHLDELVALWRSAPERLCAKHIVLKHFSVRYERGEIRAAHASLPDGLRERVTMLA